MRADHDLPLRNFGDGLMGEVVVEALPGMEAALNPLEEAQLRSEAARRIFESNEEAAPWLDEYWALIGEGWPWRQAVYLIWAAQPREKRWPKTQHELATELLGLTSDRAIRKWREQNPAMDARIAKLAASTLSKARAEIYAALIAAASKVDPRAHSDRKLALEMLGDYVPRQKMELTPGLPDDLADMDVAELRAMAQLPNGEGRSRSAPTGLGGGNMELGATLQWADLVQEVVAAYEDIEVETVLAIIYLESRGNPDVVNSKSQATGLMQVMPQEAGEIFADRPAMEELRDPRTNIEWGVKILDFYLRKEMGLWGTLRNYSGGNTWKSDELFKARYWEPFWDVYDEIARARIDLVAVEDGEG